jgi:hypothetical protein
MHNHDIGENLGRVGLFVTLTPERPAAAQSEWREDPPSQLEKGIDETIVLAVAVSAGLLVWMQWT